MGSASIGIGAEGGLVTHARRAARSLFRAGAVLLIAYLEWGQRLGSVAHNAIKNECDCGDRTLSIITAGPTHRSNKSVPADSNVYTVRHRSGQG